MSRILFLHDTDLSLLRGAELTINQLALLGRKKGFVVETDLLLNCEKAKHSIVAADLVIVNSTSRCGFEKQLLKFIIDREIRYVKIEFDYNFCARRTIACTIDESQVLCCDGEKFHLYRELFSKAALNIFQSPKHYESHAEFYGEAVKNFMVMPPTVEVDLIQNSREKNENVIPFFGDLSFLKGGKAYLDYAREHPEKTFKVYGYNRLNESIPDNVVFKGMIANDAVLEILGKTKYFFCQPYWPEPSGRLAAEAFLSGCEIIANDRIGTFSFDFYPNDIERAKREMKEAPEKFWNKITEIIRTEKATETTFEKVLVHKTSGGLGDVFYCIPALYLLKKVYNEVAFAVEPRLVSFFKKNLEGITLIDETISKAFEKDYDKVIELGNYPAYMGGFKLPHAIKYTMHDKLGQHAIAHYIDAVAKTHINLNGAVKFPYFKRKPDFDNPYYTVHAGAGVLRKTWAVENFAAIISKLHERYPHLKCKIIIGPGDPNPAFFLNDKSHVELITGDIEAVGEVFSAALFHIGNDSGISHIADAYNVPSVGIYGPTGPGAWGNFSEQHEIIWGKTGACDLKCDYEVLTRCENRVCLSSINPGRVLGAVYKLLQKSYPELLSEEIINPGLEVDVTKTDCLLKIDGNEFRIHFTNDNTEREVNQILSGDFKSMANPEMTEFMKFLKDQHIIIAIPDFNFLQIKKPLEEVA
jgi:ADP-heptose:LPS heptosyltransferase